MRIYADRQRDFARQYEQSVLQLQKMGESDRAVLEAERKLQNLLEREAKLTKELRRSGGFWRKGGDECIMRHELTKIGREKAVAERQLNDTKAEMEVVKMFRFRNGMQGIADAYRTLGDSTTAIFDCHREITELVPAISTQDVRRMAYDGATVTKRRMDELRQRLGLEAGLSESTRRRRSEPPSRSSSHHSHHRRNQGTPPPPYSPPTSSSQMNWSAQARLTNDSPPILNQATPRATTSAGCLPHAPAANVMYPRLPPNPYAKPLKSLTP
uniref:Uncharacterized protein n=1 Tax=Plectus sambesii TaxID=2011161 RepID=A0A914VSD3_9BILA